MQGMLVLLWFSWVIDRAVNPLSLQILRIGRRRHNAQPMTSFRQKTREKDVLEL